jgi:hypothetical protein
MNQVVVKSNTELLTKPTDNKKNQKFEEKSKEDAMPLVTYCTTINFTRVIPGLKAYNELRVQL